MWRAIWLAAGDLLDPRILRLVGACACLGGATFVGVWFGLDAALAWWLGADGALPAALRWLGAAATFVLAWFVFPIVYGAWLGLFLDAVATTVERRHHPNLPAARGMPVLPALLASLRFLAVALAANLLLLVLWLVPPVYAVAWVVVNGWLLGREYTELVVLRRSPPAAAAAVRQRHGAEVFALGVLFALAMTLPGLNLILPVLATAVMVHRVHAWQTSRPQAGGG
jgi:uncharacterized protein involved in cysteine biosynthesis